MRRPLKFFGAACLCALASGLVAWRLQPPRLHNLSCPIPTGYLAGIQWISSEEVIAYRLNGEESFPRIFQLRSNKNRDLPLLPKQGIAEEISEPKVSPDGKWLLYEKKSVARLHPRRTQRTHWLLIRTDGSQHQELPSSTSIYESTQAFYWLPSSQGWLIDQKVLKMIDGCRVYVHQLVTYNLEGKITAKQELPQGLYEPSTGTLQADGRILESHDDPPSFVLRTPSQPEQEECLSIPLPPGWTTAQIRQALLSYDNQRFLLVLSLPVKPIPEQGTWEELLHYKFPTDHTELWLLSRTGEKLRLVATDETIHVFSWSPDGRRVLLSVSGEENLRLLEI